ncbi:MAG: hypothetical protein IH933_12800 [Euryarchaeota archaeon]|jgi:hypothetical protein|nr:hypothetical protein [Euryarchaeota archaeon]
MDPPTPPPNAADTMRLVDEAVGGLELDPTEKREVWRFVQRELPYLWSQRTSYFIIGSYRDPYIRRLRAVQNELAKQLGAYPFVMGDLMEMPIDRLNTFDITFALLATYSDYIAGIFEKESGGEAPELGEIDDFPYFEKSTVFPRDYVWITDSNLDSKHHVIQAALTIVSTDELTEKNVRKEVTSLINRAQERGVSVSGQDVWDAITDRKETDTELATYSWVHRNKFRKFELHDRCFPWTTEDELRTAVESLPSPTPRPHWEESNDQ